RRRAARSASRHPPRAAQSPTDTRCGRRARPARAAPRAAQPAPARGPAAEHRYGGAPYRPTPGWPAERAPASTHARRGCAGPTTGGAAPTYHKVGKPREHRLGKPRQLTRIDGAITVAERHQVGPCGEQTGLAGGAVATLRTCHDRGAQLSGQPPRTIRRAVV